MILNLFAILPSNRGTVPLSALQDHAKRHLGSDLGITLRQLAGRGLIELVWGADENAVKLTAKGAIRVAFLPPSQWLG